ncbi:hypothetical protein BH23PSE1_BH23PSE1_02890 [soil metagenome]
MHNHLDGAVDGTGCFSPEQVTLLERILSDAVGEVRKDPGLAAGGPVDWLETRQRLASAIISHANNGESDPRRLVKMALKTLA